MPDHPPGLVRYEKARLALRDAKTVDEAAEIRDRAEAARAYAAQVKDTELETWAAEIKLRAERRLGELLRIMADEGQRPRSRPPKGSAPPTLSTLGITKQQSSVFQQLAAVPERDFEVYIQEAQTHEAPVSSRAARRHLLRPQHHAHRTVDRVWPVGRYGVILCDPPWKPDAGLLDPTREIERQYPTLGVEALCGFAPEIEARSASDSVLLLWAVAPKTAEAVRVIDAWGFTVKSGAVWVKPSVGMGYWFRSRHELLILATKGSPATPLERDRPDSVWEAPRRQHSQKPDLQYERIERMFPGVPKLELFARPCRARPSTWATWGNEAI